MKKKLAAGILSIVLMSAMAMPVMAEEKNMTVQYSQGSTYMVSIPATTLSQTEEVNQTVAAAAINIEPGQMLQVSITGITDGKVTLKRSDGKETTTTTVSKNKNGGNPINGDTVIAQFKDQSAEFINGTVGELYFSPVAEGTAAGNYSGSITYTLEVVKQN